MLHGIDLALPAGRWTAIVGPNGAGKTTLLKALAQLLPSRGAGAHRWAATRDAWSPRERARLLAWLGQNEGGAHDLLAYDVVMLGRLPHQSWLGAPSRAGPRRGRSRDARDPVLGLARAAPLGSLSGGERQRVLLARALAVQAPLLLMDEPLANLDPPHQADWLRIVRAPCAARRHRGERAARDHHGAACRRDGGDAGGPGAAPGRLRRIRRRIARWNACSTGASPCTRWPGNGWRCPTM